MQGKLRNSELTKQTVDGTRMGLKLLKPEANVK